MKKLNKAQKLRNSRRKVWISNPSFRRYHKKRVKNNIFNEDLIILLHKVGIQRGGKEVLAQYNEYVTNSFSDIKGVVIKHIIIGEYESSQTDIEVLYPSSDYIKKLKSLEKVKEYKRKVRLFRFTESLKK